MRVTFDGTLEGIILEAEAFLDDVKIGRAATQHAPPAQEQGPALPPWPGNAQAAQQPAPPQVAPGAAPPCAVHGPGTMTYHVPGTNKAGKAYNASWRCSVAGCSGTIVWIN